MAYRIACAVRVPLPRLAAGGGALLNEMLRPKGSSGPMEKVISRYKIINQ